jgi:hypothetical protein
MAPPALIKLVNRFSTNALAAEAGFEVGDAPSRSFAVISLYADWEEFSRRLLYLSAAKRPIAADGRVVPRAPGIRTAADVDAALLKWKKQRRLVLHLGAPGAMVDACKALQVSNERVITAAVLAQQSPAEALRVARNFLAHQNPSTARQVVAGPTASALEVKALVSWLAEPLVGGRSRFGAWSGDLVSVARAAIN